MPDYYKIVIKMNKMKVKVIHLLKFFSITGYSEEMEKRNSEKLQKMVSPDRVEIRIKYIRPQ